MNATTRRAGSVAPVNALTRRAGVFCLSFLVMLCCLAGLARPAGAQGTPDLVWMRGGLAGNVNAISYSPDGRFFATGEGSSLNESIPGNRRILLWRSSDNMLLKICVHAAGVNAIAFSPDSAIVAGGDASGEVRLWNVPEGTLLKALPGLPASVRSLAFSPNGQLLAIGLQTGTVLVYRVADGALVHTVSGHVGFVGSVAFSPDGTLLASRDGRTTADTSLCLWNAANGALLRAVPLPRLEYPTVCKASFSPDGQSVFVALGGDGIRRVRVVDGATVATFHSRNLQIPYPRDFALSSDGQRIITLYNNPLGGDSFLQVQRVADGAVLQFSPLLNDLPLTRSTHGFSPFALSPDGSRIITHSRNQDRHYLFLLNGATLQPISRINLWNHINPNTERDWSRTIAVSPDGQWGICLTNSFHEVFRLTDGATVGQVPGGIIVGAAFSPDSSVLITLDSGWNVVSAWRIPGMTRIWEHRIQQATTSGGVVISPDGSLFASSSRAATFTGTGTEVRRALDGQLVHSFVAPNFANTFAFSPDGRYLALGLDQNRNSSVRVFRTSDWSEFFLSPSLAPAKIESLTYSPDGKSIAVGLRGSTRNLAILDAATGAVPYRLNEQATGPSISYSPDGTVMVTSGRDSNSGDQSLRIRRAADGELLAQYFGTGNPVPLTATYTADGRFLVYALTDGTIAMALNNYRMGVFPNRGGNTGDVTVSIVTTEAKLNPSIGAEVRLLAEGLPDIIGQNTAVNTDRMVTTTFNLRGAILGERRIVITTPSTERLEIPKAFEVIQGKEAYLRSKVLGRSIVRLGRSNTYYIHLVNTGNIDSDLSLMRVQIPRIFGWQMPDHTPSIVEVGESSVSIAGPVGVLPPYGISVIPLHLTATALNQNPLQLPRVMAWANSGSSLAVRYVGDMNEPLIMRLESSEKKVIELFGQPDITGFVRSISTARLTHGGSQATITFDTRGLPVYVAHTDGNAFALSYPSSRTIMVQPLPADGSITEPFAVDTGGIDGRGNTYHLGDPPRIPIAPNPCDQLAFCRFLEQVIGTISGFNKVIQSPLGIRIRALIAAAVIGTRNPYALSMEFLAEGLFYVLDYAISFAEKDIAKWCESLEKQCIQVSASYDPNELYGPIGFQAPGWVSDDEPFRYAVSFENLPTATLPAAEVVVTDRLDPITLDLTTVDLKSITFAGYTVTPTIENSPPVGPKQFTARVDLRPQRNLIVEVQTSLDMLTGEMKWKFISLDPVTLQPPDDPLAGFLDPGVGGSALFTVLPKKEMPTGTVVGNQASIVFDFNDPIITNAWFNTLDNDNPASKVQSLTADQNGSRFTVAWGGTDVGSGLRDFAVSVSDNGGPFTTWLANTMDKQATFTGVPGHTYAFKSQARDNVYNREPEHPAADTITRIGVAAVDVSAQVSVTRGGFRRNRATGRFQQEITLTNTGGSAVSGPVSLVLDGLTDGVTLFGATGMTAALAPFDSPYRNVTGGSLAAGQTLKVMLEFTNPANAAISYTPRVLAGPGLR